MKNTTALRKWAEIQLETRHWTRADLARETGLAESTWSRFYRGINKNLDEGTVTAMCKVFGVDTDFIFKLSSGNLYPIADTSTGRVQEGPDRNNRWKWMRLADWLATQPANVQDGVLAVAASHGYQP
jgi:transcriptional regulator with XRE-family HTH domain